MLCEPLCFILSKVSKIGKNVLSKYVIDNMEAAAITSAKTQLMKDVENLQLDKMPRVIGRYDVSKRAENEVKDIFVLIDFLDQNKLLDMLPRYVTDDPDNLPSIRIFDGDLGFMMKRFDQMERKVEKLTSLIAAINDAQSHLADKQAWPTLQQTAQPLLLAPPPIVNLQDAHKSSYTSACRRTMTSGKTPNAVNHERLQPRAEAADNIGSGMVIGSVTQPINDQLFHAPGTEWASVTSTPDHVHRPSIYDAKERELGDSDSRFTVVQNKKKRHKPDTSGPRPADGSNNRRRPLAVGHATLRPNSPGHASLSAAPRKAINSEVFYIDNIGPSHTVNDVRKFVSSLSVRVLSCFEVKPRKRRVDYMPDRKAFRLCILSEDRDKLFDENKWPMHITLSDWFFKPKDSEAENTNRIDNQSDSNSRSSRASSRDRPSRLSRGSSSGRSQQNDDVAAAFCAAAALVTAVDQQQLSDSTLKADESLRSDLCDEIIQSSTSSIAEVVQNAVIGMTDNTTSPDREEFMDADATILTQEEQSADNLTSDLILQHE